VTTLSRFATRVAGSLRYRAAYARDTLVAAVCKNRIDAYWCDCRNFGDHITPMLLRHYGFTPLHASQEDAKIVSTGSILEHLADTYSGLIVGAGFLYETSRRSFPKATVLAVRGRLTLERLGRRGSNVVLGDPGLLAAHVIGRRAEKRFELGLVPHYVDRRNPFLDEIWQRNRGDVTIINVERKRPLHVFREIDMCQHIVSSSLHGLIVADSLGIPSAWMASPGLEGGRFKFDDYYSSINRGVSNPMVLCGYQTVRELTEKTSLKPQEEVDKVVFHLNSIFLELAKMYAIKQKPSCHYHKPC